MRTDTRKQLEFLPLLSMDRAAHLVNASKTAIYRAMRTGAVTPETDEPPWEFDAADLAEAWRQRLLAQYQLTARRLRMFEFRLHVVERELRAGASLAGALLADPGDDGFAVAKSEKSPQELLFAVSAVSAVPSLRR